MKKSIVAAIAALFLLSSAHQSRALPAPPVVTTTSTSVGAGVYVAGGIVGIAAALCVYDLYLKFSGLKNWDGTPKKGVTPKFP